MFPSKGVRTEENYAVSESSTQELSALSAPFPTPTEKKREAREKPQL